MMNRRIFFIFCLLWGTFFLNPVPSPAFWIWTPETNKWVNPKYSVKETPIEQLQVGMDLYQAKEYEEAIREFKKLIKHYPLAKEAPEAQYYIARSLEDQGKVFDAFQSYQIVIDKYPFSERSAEVVQRQYDIGVNLLEGQNKRGKWSQAFLGTDYNVIDVFKAVIKNAPYGPLAPLAQYKIALYLQEKQLYQEARDEFEKVINDYPESEWAKAAQYQIAMTDTRRAPEAQYEQETTKAAVEEFKEFVTSYPDAELSSQAKDQIHGLLEKEAENNFVIARFYEKQKNYKSAKIYYEIIVNDYADSSLAAKALEKIREITPKL